LHVVTGDNVLRPVLDVDDHKAFEWIEQLLPSFNVITAATPGEAAHRVSNSAPRFVLADAAFPGLSLVARIAQQSAPATTFIVLTREDRDLQWAHDQGMLAISQRAIPVAVAETAETYRLLSA
jgi:DNA-binding NarL/FixJ family response regulator